MDGKELKRFVVDAASFRDPIYDVDITGGVRDVLGKEHHYNLVDATEQEMEVVKVSVSYITKRGNLRTPTKYVFFQDLPEEDDAMVKIVGDFMKKFYDRLAEEAPYRAVSDLKILSVERYAVARL